MVIEAVQFGLIWPHIHNFYTFYHLYSLLFLHSLGKCQNSDASATLGNYIILG